MTPQTTATIKVVRLTPECRAAADGEADVAAAGVAEVGDGEDAGVSFAFWALMSAAAELTDPMKSLSGLAVVVACAIVPAMLANSNATECKGFCCIFRGVWIAAGQCMLYQLNASKV